MTVQVEGNEPDQLTDPTSGQNKWGLVEPLSLDVVVRHVTEVGIL